MDDEANKAVCSYCKGENIVKYGKRSNMKGLTQVYFCKSCNRRFTPKDGFRRMKHDKKIITVALDCYAKGMSLRGVKNHLRMFYGVKLSHVGILYWVRKYGTLIRNYADQAKIVSDKLYADETALLFNNWQNWLWNVMDAKSRFWVTASVSVFKNQLAANKTFEITRSRLVNEPSIIATDGAVHYRQSIFQSFPNVQHFRYVTPEAKKEMQIMERLNGSLKQRVKVMRGMWCARTAKDIIEIYRVYYNFVRPHSSLHNRTPAEVLGLTPHWTGNKWEKIIELSEKHG